MFSWGVGGSTPLSGGGLIGSHTLPSLPLLPLPLLPLLVLPLPLRRCYCHPDAAALLRCCRRFCCCCRRLCCLAVAAVISLLRFRCCTLAAALPLPAARHLPPAACCGRRVSAGPAGCWDTGQRSCNFAGIHGPAIPKKPGSMPGSHQNNQDPIDLALSPTFSRITIFRNSFSSSGGAACAASCRTAAISSSGGALLCARRVPAFLRLAAQKQPSGLNADANTKCKLRQKGS